MDKRFNIVRFTKIETVEKGRFGGYCDVSRMYIDIPFISHKEHTFCMPDIDNYKLLYNPMFFQKTIDSQPWKRRTVVYFKSKNEDDYSFGFDWKDYLINFLIRNYNGVKKGKNCYLMHKNYKGLPLKMKYLLPIHPDIFSLLLENNLNDLTKPNSYGLER